ncbi:uncharacterized protein isoform X3 [Rhodnius prolixus]|uniref:uncharacterized protein isoform X3 n=1 Tax=Rhodnius prolixus TaxID=13249 RepID=UPI003D187C08
MMWTPVTPKNDNTAKTPSARSKHSVTLCGGYLYLLAGRNGNIPLKDLWRYSLNEGVWELLEPDGDRPPSLQEHSAVAYKESIYVFGGEVGFSACNEAPLWVYNVKNNNWRKVRGSRGAMLPKGRRGHSALVHRSTMVIYGGYRDLRGSCNELWVFHFETESWHLLSGSPTCPPARHKHSMVIHDGSIWIYGGMTDLQERSDLWRFDTVRKLWQQVKSKVSPGALHSHAVCKLPSSMLVFGGERSGQPNNELWRFHFATETWEKITLDGILPQPRSESVALTVPDLLLQNNSCVSKSSPKRFRGGGSVDRQDDEVAPPPTTNTRQDYFSVPQHLQNKRKGFPKSASVRFGNPLATPEENCDETSDYASVETMNRITDKKKDGGPYSFANPNYLGPDIKEILSDNEYVQVLNSPPDSVLEDSLGRSNSRQELIELKPIPPKSLPLAFNSYNNEMISFRDKKGRAMSATRAERNTSFCVFIIGGKERGQVTVFKRPISIWKLQLNSTVY